MLLHPGYYGMRVKMFPPQPVVVAAERAQESHRQFFLHPADFALGLGGELEDELL